MDKHHEVEVPAFNYAIWLYDMNADDVFDHDRHLIVDSSLGLIEEEGDIPASSLSSPKDEGGPSGITESKGP